MTDKKPTAPTLATFADLMRIIDRDPYARAAWFANVEAGASTEQALIGVIVAVVGAREEMTAEFVRRERFGPSSLKPVLDLWHRYPEHIITGPPFVPDQPPPPGPTLRPIVCDSTPTPREAS